MIKGILKITVLTLFILAVQQVIFYLNLSIPFGEKFIGTLLFFFLQSIIIHVLFRLAHEELQMDIPILVMGAMTIRMLTSLMAVGLVVYLGVIDMTNFIITFFTVYLFYFVFEIFTVLSNLRSNLK
jgi:tetrahydromethanopterin S-methyltransferase subunit C